jgi:glc operon protein GlcG
MKRRMSTPLTVSLTVALIAISGLCAAQVTNKPVLTLDGAKQIIAAAASHARTKAGTAAIAIVDDGGNLIALELLDNTFPAAANISIGKARTAAIFKKPTLTFEDTVNKGRTSMTTLKDFTPLQGGVPIEVDGKVVGAIGVSGAANAQEDQEVAMASAANHFASQGGGSASSPAAISSSAPVTYFDKNQVDASFAKGAILYPGDGHNYQVHTSRRDKPGQVEVHTLDADVIYVLQGHTTFITGGTLLDGKTIAPNEIRGMQLNGGDTRQLAQGDVIIVPHGVPHWFKEVSEPFLYLTVKVR